MFDCETLPRSTLPEVYDVCVIGGGPAGSALAIRLAQLGRSVVVVEKVPFPRSHVGESLAGGVLPLIDVLGIRSQIETTRFLRAPKAIVLWAGQMRQRDTHGGYQVDRGVFDAILLRAACAEGASVRQPARALNVEHAGNWSVQLDSGEVLHARFLADTAGRSRILGGRKTVSGSRTIAMYAYWSNVDAEEGDTLVEAGTSQWYWGAPLPDGSFNATVFVDKENAQRERYLDLIRHSHLLSARLTKGDCGEVRICDATSFLDEIPVTNDSIKAGDSAISIDPLSSQGMQTALGTALHAAVVINTVLDRPEDTELALDFYRQRISESSKFHAQVAGDLYREQNEFAPDPFWKARATNFNLMDSRRKSPPVALEQRVQICALARIIPHAMVNDRYIVQSNAVELNGTKYGRLGNFSIPTLLDVAIRPIFTKDLLQHWSAEMPPALAMQVLEWIWACGLIEATE
jgi:flavin-dependent dehydrogenase